MPLGVLIETVWGPALAQPVAAAGLEATCANSPGPRCCFCCCCRPQPGQKPKDARKRCLAQEGQGVQPERESGSCLGGSSGASDVPRAACLLMIPMRSSSSLCCWAGVGQGKGRRRRRRRGEEEGEGDGEEGTCQTIGEGERENAGRQRISTGKNLVTDENLAWRRTMLSTQGLGHSRP